MSLIKNIGLKIMLFFIYSTCFLYSFFDPEFGKYLLSFTMVYNLYLMFLFKNQQSLFICIFFANSYCLYLIPYYFFDVHYSTYNTFITMEYTNSVVRINGLFTILLFSMIDVKSLRSNEFLPQKPNAIIYYICIVIMMVIVMYVFCLDSIFVSPYGNDYNNSSVYEYYFIFSLCAYCFSDNEFKKKALLYLNALYIIGILLIGLRLVVLQVSLMLFMLFFENKFKIKWIVLLLFVGIVFFSLWAKIRGWNNDISDLNTILLGNKENFIVSNQGDVFATSVTQYALVQMDFFDAFFRLKAFLSFFANVFLFPEVQLKEGFLNRCLGGYSVGGGGFGSIYAFVWLDYVGVILLSTYISYFINYIYKKSKKSFISLYGFFLVMTFFRWYAYNLYIVFKMGFWFLLIYTCFSVVDLKLKMIKMKE